MKNKGFVQFLVILLAVVSLYQLSFTLVTNNVENGVEEEVIAKVGSKDAPNYAKEYKRHIDSIQNEAVYPVFGYTYQECKKREINLGLDLQGGMNVTLEISTPDMVRGLAGEDKDPQFNEAMKRAEAVYKGQGSFVDYFKKEYEAINPEKGLARIFYTKNRKADLPNQYNSTNDDIYAWLKKEEKAKVGETYKVIRTRIDQFNVTQPNVQRLDNGRILVELPGVDDADRVINLLQSSAQLEFWEVYNNDQVYKFFEEARTIVSEELRVDEPAADSSEEVAALEVETLDESGDSAEQGFDAEGLQTLETAEDTNETESIVEDTSTVDSTENKQLTEAEQKVEYPFMSRMALPRDNEGNVTIRNFVGFVHESEVDFFNKFLSDTSTHEAKSVFPDNLVFKWSFDKTEDGFYTLYAMRGSGRNDGPALDGDVIDNARPTLNPNGSYEVNMIMNRVAAKEWAIITENASAKTPKEAVAIVLDGRVYSAPTVQGKIPNGSSSISGNFEMEDAEDLANILKAGRLSVPARVASQTVVGPTLGQAAINAGLISLAVGFIAVILFMMFYYGRAGIYAVIALLANLFFILGVLSGYGAALTLPGMAGLVLTIGMAVDANVLIFERVKEELTSGKGFKLAVRQGYKAALSSIVDANVTTLIAAVILMVLGKGPVAGFGIILLIGILSSLFTSILLTRLFVENDIKQGREIPFTTGMSKNLLSKFSYNFIGNRKKFYIISGVIILGGLASMLTNGVNLGVDFKGGWSYVINIDSAENTEAIKQELTKALQDNVEVKTYGEQGDYMVTTTVLIDSKDSLAHLTVKDTIIGGLAKFGVSDDDILSESKVGPTIAEDIKTDSTLAIILALIGMFIYIVSRFRKWGYGLGATVALFHDVLIVFSIYSIMPMIVDFQLSVDQAFIAAILTVVGYSINDTVVVFDRVREFLGLHKYESNTAGVINDAINQTLSRTLVTSLTTLLVVLILFLFGGEGLKGFTFALLVGVAVGTYSSICIATPIVVDFTKKKNQ